MPYDPTDPRAVLAPSRNVAGVARPAFARNLQEEPPDEHHACGSRTWWTRSQSVVVGYTDAIAGDTLTEPDRIDDERIVLALGARLRIEHGATSIEVDEPSVVVIGAGSPRITVLADGTVVRLSAAGTAPLLADRCANAADYATPDANVAPFRTWPLPLDTSRPLRTYPLSSFALEGGKLGRIFRCSTLMVNVFADGEGPRDPSKLSPHHHDDFEQISLQVRGDYVHHMRAPWTPDSSTWRADEHLHCRAPAVVVIPPLLIHTSQGIGDMPHWLIDVFAPPRFDFSKQPGWVRNADDYPMPAS